MLRQYSVLLTVWELLLVNRDTKLDLCGRGTLIRGTASIRLIFGHVYGGIFLIIDWGPGPLWVLPPPGEGAPFRKKKSSWSWEWEQVSEWLSSMRPLLLPPFLPSMVDSVGARKSYTQTPFPPSSSGHGVYQSNGKQTKTLSNLFLFWRTCNGASYSSWHLRQGEIHGELKEKGRIFPEVPPQVLPCPLCLPPARVSMALAS